MRLKTWSYTPADDSTAGYVSQKTGAAGACTLVATSPGDGLAHFVIVTPGADDASGVNFVVVGTDIVGNVITATLAGANATPTQSTVYFATITSITTSATLGTNKVDIGWTDDVIGPAIPIDPKAGIAAAVSVDISGTINFTIQEMWKNIFDVGSAYQTSTAWLDVSALASKSADTASTLNIGASAWRLKLNSLSNGATIVISVSQPTSWGN